jgi:large subunit ribosomal protein L25
MAQANLNVAKRDVLGKKVRFLRRQGQTPVHIFGHGVKSMAAQCDTEQLKQILTGRGRTKVFVLNVEGEKRSRRVLVGEVQKDFLRGILLHVDFHQVRKTDVVKVEIPIVLVGEAPALKLQENTLMHAIKSLEVECLPDDIPEEVKLDISSLTDRGQMIRVKDVNLGKEVTVLEDPEQVIVGVEAPTVEKEAEEVIEEVKVVGEEPEVASEET